jgi:hypothetical protein
VQIKLSCAFIHSIFFKPLKINIFPFEKWQQLISAIKPNVQVIEHDRRCHLGFGLVSKENEASCLWKKSLPTG